MDPQEILKKKENHKIEPLTDYAKSKVNSEKKLKKLSDNRFKVISLRFATAAGYSPKLRLDLVFNDFVANSITNKKILILSDIYTTLAQFIIIIVLRGKKGHIYKKIYDTKKLSIKKSRYNENYASSSVFANQLHRTKIC